MSPSHHHPKAGKSITTVNERSVTAPKMKLTREDKASRSKVWTQGDGTQKKIKDLDDIHLCRIIRKIIKNAEKDIMWLESNPPMFSGEMAQLFADAEYDALMESDALEIASAKHPLFDDLVAEAERRGLNYVDDWRDI